MKPDEDRKNKKQVRVHDWPKIIFRIDPIEKIAFEDALSESNEEKTRVLRNFVRKYVRVGKRD